MQAVVRQVGSSVKLCWAQHASARHGRSVMLHVTAQQPIGSQIAANFAVNHR